MFSVRLAFVVTTVWTFSVSGPSRGAEKDSPRTPAAPSPADTRATQNPPSPGEKPTAPGAAKPSGKAKPAESKPSAGVAGKPASGAAAASAPRSVSMVRWKEVASLPAVSGQSKPGLAGVFAGALDAARAVVAGGSFFEGKGPLEGGQKSFSDEVLVLTQTPGAAGADPSYTWEKSGLKLPRPLAYGASVTLETGVLMIGGTDGTVCVPEVQFLSWDSATRQPILSEFPALPKPLAFLGAGRAGSWVVVVGGTTSPDGRSGADVFGLDLNTRDDPAAFVWQTLPSLPAAVHFPIVVGEGEESGAFLHVFGGRDLRPDRADTVLSEGWRFDVAAQTWASTGPIAPGPDAAPIPLMGGTALALEERRVLVIGGDDGVLARLLEHNAQRTGSIEERESYARLNAAILGAHPGHRRTQLLFDARMGKWREAGVFPEAAPAVTPAFLWDGAVLLIGGEPAPGRRSAKVWLGTLDAE